jgi:hypothetical protein
MANSIQIRTSPLLRQFATEIRPGMIEVTTKLGPETLSRATFATVDYPSELDQREPFLRTLALRANPQFPGILQDKVDLCIEGQAQAVQQVLAR